MAGVALARTFVIGVFAACVCAMPTPAAAQNMPVSSFLAKADALAAKGMMAMFSSDVTALKDEIKAASTAYRASPASRAPRSCPPVPGQAKVSSDEIIAAFRAMPLAQRTTTSVKSAFTDFMVRRYPCK
jgi:hypothetical protein